MVPGRPERHTETLCPHVRRFIFWIHYEHKSSYCFTLWPKTPNCPITEWLVSSLSQFSRPSLCYFQPSWSFLFYWAAAEYTALFTLFYWVCVCPPPIHRNPCVRVTLQGSCGLPSYFQCLLPTHQWKASHGPSTLRVWTIRIRFTGAATINLTPALGNLLSLAVSLNTGQH